VHADVVYRPEAGQFWFRAPIAQRRAAVADLHLDQLDLAEGIRLDQTPRLQEAGVVAGLEVDPQPHACLAAFIQDALGVCDRGRHRLVAKHVLARPGRGDGLVGVEGVGRVDRHDVDFGVG
jgi:hypothetical protein